MAGVPDLPVGCFLQQLCSSVAKHEVFGHIFALQPQIRCQEWYAEHISGAFAKSCSRAGAVHFLFKMLLSLKSSPKKSRMPPTTRAPILPLQKILRRRRRGCIHNMLGHILLQNHKHHGVFGHINVAIPCNNNTKATPCVHS